ncbi:uncharacterized protein V1513DRAFT_456365 [Lipomyces chichibuensis]|uniref:uncharacterized protein n=1 Tax=Lipomyces chichibuensis TaxID=1546026 RepID=UPI003343FF2C
MHTGGQQAGVQPVFRFQLNCIDCYQGVPSSYDRNISPLGDNEEFEFCKVPIIRVFGNSDSGQKVCAHIHGIFPYLFIEYSGSLDKQHVDEYIQELYMSINNALRASFQHNSKDARNTFVANIVLCKGVPFYGFHIGWKYFLKVYMLSPSIMGRLADLLRDAAVLGIPVRVYEAQLPYILQFMADFNLFGCGWVNVNNLRFRSPVPEYAGIGVKAFEWTTDTIRAHMISGPEIVARTSYCALEIDVQAQHIMNRYDIKERNLHHDFIERTNPIPADFKFMHSMAELWRDERRRRKMRRVPPKDVPSMSASGLREESCWRNEEELRGKLLQSIQREECASKAVSYNSYRVCTGEEDKVPSAFEVLDNMFSFAHSELSGSSSSQTYEESFWENVVTEDLDKLENSTIRKSRPVRFLLEDDSEDVPAAQKYLKRKNIGTSSSDSQSHSNLTVSSQTKGSVDATHTLVIKAFGYVTKSAEQAQNLSREYTPKPALRASSMTEFGTSVKNIQSAETLSSQEQRSNDSLVKKMRFDESASTANGSQSGKAEAETSYDTTLSIVSPPEMLRRLSLASTPNSRHKFLGNDIMMAFGIKKKLFLISDSPMVSSNILGSLEDFGQPRVLYRDAYYSLDKDVPLRPREYAGKEFKLLGGSALYLPEFAAGLENSEKNAHGDGGSRFRVWQYGIVPPSAAEVKKWTNQWQSGKEDAMFATSNKTIHSQIDGPTQNASPNLSQRRRNEYARSSITMSVFSLEVHANTQDRLVPNPQKDPIAFLTWIFQPSQGQANDELATGIIIVSDNEEDIIRLKKQFDQETLTVVSDELDLINCLIDTIRRLDPDVFAGYEVQNSSWGYIIERVHHRFEYDLQDEFSRVKTVKANNGNFDRWGFAHASSIKITGRHVFNVWRLLRNSVNLLQYTMQNCAFQILKKRVPFYTNQDLSKWLQSREAGQVARAIQYYISRASLNLELLKDQEVIERTSEQARLLGVDFYSVISRGSQFKVESLMGRIAKAENFMLIAPSRRMVGGQNALEALPLVMEPKSNFYTSPVVVLDFQSLYPSIMIAHNYCYSTCLGRVDSWRGRNKLGVTSLDLPDGILSLLKDYLTVSPNGLIFVKQSIRRSLLAKMLTEILETRVMVKNEMKDTDSDGLRKLLNNRQLALKYIANVTYGYTSASFSGRMPCAEIADAIVSSGREILERSIELINSTERWGAHVAYGDTDSLFVHLPGKSKDQAFDIGKEISETVTRMNPRPIKLKMEKVYLPCVLLAKKRYVGFSYETKDQKEPIFDAKGTETVRRDGTPAEQKIEEKALKILFRTSDLSAVKEYVQDQCTKIMSGHVSIQDFCFAKEVRMGTYSERGLLPPGAMISARKMQEDPRAEPQYGERVPYVVIAGALGSRLVDRCVPPETLLMDNNMFLDSDYYITKNIIPPLDRIFSLIGVSVRSWYDEMPKIIRIPHQLQDSDSVSKRSLIHSYMKSSLCIVCQVNDASNSLICAYCKADVAKSYYILQSRGINLQRNLCNLLDVCRSCARISRAEDVACVSQDCPVYFSRVRATSKVRYSRKISEVFEKQVLSRDDLAW